MAADEMVLVRECQRKRSSFKREIVSWIYLGEIWIQNMMNREEQRSRAVVCTGRNNQTKTHLTEMNHLLQTCGRRKRSLQSRQESSS